MSDDDRALILDLPYRLRRVDPGSYLVREGDVPSHCAVLVTGYAYRQIGVATSPDGETWTRYEGNPVLTIDYSNDVDGVHVHMPTVVIGPDATWQMYYSCYQNNVGNRICRASSPDGLTWTPEGVVLDQGAEGEFDEGSLRSPDVLIAEDGTWVMLYNGTDPEQHYGPTGLATSPDGTHEWMFEFFSDVGTKWTQRALDEAGVHAMGRRSYEIMGPYWTKSSGPVATSMNGKPKAVFSRTLEEGHGTVLVHGGPGLAASLTRASLVDELDEHLKLELVDQQRFRSGHRGLPLRHLAG